MRCEVTVEILWTQRRNLGLPTGTALSGLQPGKVLRRCGTADDTVRLVAERCFIDDGVVELGIDALLPAPRFGKDVMNIHGLVEEDREVEALAAAEILGAPSHQQGMDAFVGRRQACAHGEQAISLKQALLDRRRLGAAR